MYQTKLLELLQTLSSREWHELQAHIHAPVFNKHPKIQKLFDLIFTAVQKEQPGHLDKEKVFARLYPKKRFDEYALNNLTSDLLRLLEQYLVEANLKEDKITTQLRLLDILSTRNIPNQYQQQIKATRKWIDRSPHRDARYHFHHYQLAAHADAHFMASGSRGIDHSLQQKVDHLDQFYFAARLKEACEMVNRQNITAAAYDLSFLDVLLPHIECNWDQLSATPAIAIYYHIYGALTSDQHEDHYRSLKAALRQHYALFQESEVRGMYNYARNYCIKQINSGNSAYLQAVFELYQFLLDREIIFEDGYLTQWDYKNIITTGLRLKAYQWTEAFIHDYECFLPPAHQSNAYAFNLASFQYETGQYEAALTTLIDVEFTDVYYNLGAKSLLLRLYYELEEEEALFSLLETFRLYLKRNKLISAYQRKVHNNLIRFVKKAFKIKTAHSSRDQDKRIAQLKQQVAATKEINNINWLQQKIEELECD